MVEIRCVEGSSFSLSAASPSPPEGDGVHAYAPTSESVKGSRGHATIIWISSVIPKAYIMGK